MSGMGFEFTPDGIREITDRASSGAGIAGPAPAAIPAAAFVQSLRDQPKPADAPPGKPVRQTKRQDASEPVDAIRVLRQRRKWLVSEVKRLKKYEAELAEIERMLKPPTPVRSIESARRVTG